MPSGLLMASAVASAFVASVAAMWLVTGIAHADLGCRAGQSFDTWLAEFKLEATGQGISNPTLAALDGLTIDPRVLTQDRGQPTLSQSFLDFASRAVSADR